MIAYYLIVTMKWCLRTKGMNPKLLVTWDMLVQQVMKEDKNILSSYLLLSISFSKKALITAFSPAGRL